MEREKEDDPYEAIGYGDFGSYFRRKKQKLRLQQEEIAAQIAPGVQQIFEGIVVYVNGYTYPPIHVSKSSTTHIIASNLTQAKMKEFQNYKVAKPEWIVESVKANKLLPWHKFSTLRVASSFTKFGEVSSSSTSVLSPDASSRFSNAGTTTIPSQPASFVSTGRLANIQNEASVREVTQKVDDALYEDQASEMQRCNTKLEEGENQSIGVQYNEDELFSGELDLEELQSLLTPPNDNEDHELEGLPDKNQDPSTINTTFVHNPFVNVNMQSPMDAMTGAGNDVQTSVDHIASSDDRHPTLIELSVPWNRLNSSVQPGFVEKFYQSSRLHYLSAWKAKLRELTAEIQKDRVPLNYKNKDKIIMHIDFDCFFASVATRGKPELQNRPVAVAHGSGGSTSNSEIASCNYLARSFGVKNGMHLQRARTLCPDLMVVPYEFQEYEDISIEFYKIILSYADELQAVSVDEALVDVTSKCIPYWSMDGHHQQAEELSVQMDPGALAEQVRKEIFDATGCHASVGIAPNILLAKLATKRAKPHGQYIWPSTPGSERTLRELQGSVSLLLPDVDDEPDLTLPGSDNGSQFHKPETPVAKKSKSQKEFAVQDLPGVGYKTIQELEERFSARTLYELQQIPKEELQRVCGVKTGEMLYNSCRGIDETTLASDREKTRQSVSAEISWGVRFENQEQVDIFIADLAKEVSKRLKEINRKGKSVVLKVMKRKEHVGGQWKHLGHGPVDQFARTGQLPIYTDDPELISTEARRLLLYFKFNVLDLRGIGIQVLKLNNDAINTTPKPISVTTDYMNQTTLTSTLFQPKRLLSTKAAKDPTPPIQVSAQDNAPTLKPTDQTKVIASYNYTEGGPTMEIDSDTFKELPQEIQAELSLQYRLVFVNLDQNKSTDVQVDVQGESNTVPVQEKAKSRHMSIGDDALPPWSQVDPSELMAMSTPAIRDTLKGYAVKHKDNNETDILRDTNSDHSLDSGVLPSPSKLDKSVLQALPPEIRAEIEQEYTLIMENQELIQKLAQSGSVESARPTPGGLLLQSSALMERQGLGRGKGRNVIRGSVRSRPRGRGRGRGRAIGGDIVPKRNKHGGMEGFENSGRSLHQRAGPNDVTDAQTNQIPDLDESFLLALPEDLRAEVVAAHRLEVVKSRRRQADLADAAKNNRPQDSRHGAEHNNYGRGLGEKGFVLLERPTLMNMRGVDELRGMLAEWVQSTLVSGSEQPLQERLTSATAEDHSSSSSKVDVTLYDEGPNPEDVQSFLEFLVKIIYMERDLERARLLLRYLRRKIAQNQSRAAPADANPKHIQVLMSWPEALQKVTSIVKTVVLQIYGGSFVLD
ncbi:deoxycytidyl transferase [Lobosporangium transversale]|nr:deoxycytidyl transferase [Lobosporangium transversale]